VDAFSGRNVRADFIMAELDHSPNAHPKAANDMAQRVQRAAAAELRSKT